MPNMSSSSSSPYYLTTPIYYVNDKPHIGHCYTTTLADVMSRFQRLVRGEPAPGGEPRQVFLLTGTDEHADKVVTSAAAHGRTPQEWADENAEAFKRAFGLMGVASDDFIRTTQPRHKDRVPQYIAAMLRSGAIYRGEYTGWYDEGQEEYVPENAAREQDYRSAVSKKPLVKRTEPCYFFRLSKYQGALEAHYAAHPEFVLPDARRQEVLGRLRLGLNDVPVSRPVTSDPATQWGIRIPGDEANRVYVWIDALFNYLTVVDTPQRRRFWPASVHLIGKDILWFHAVIWPALLLALRESDPEFAWVGLPRTVFGHGWWISNGEKMSKSLGNFIDIDTLAAYSNAFGVDSVRWFLATQGPLSGTDADFSHAKFVESYNADLANGIGNCASRVGNMVDKYFGGVLPDHGGAFVREVIETDSVVRRFDWPTLTRESAAGAQAALATFDLAGALGHATNLIRQVDIFINLTRPFTIAKQVEKGEASKEGLGHILYQCAESIRVASVLMNAAMPTKMAQLWTAWNCTPREGLTLEQVCQFGDGPASLKPGQNLGKGEILFMRADPKLPAPK